ncbi:MAG: hypothetical protein IKP05_03430 [Alphaproteobacteria bacterium]|nr:hypothetical protein [Alphaproteobacteria bacterium]
MKPYEIQGFSIKNTQKFPKKHKNAKNRRFPPLLRVFTHQNRPKPAEIRHFLKISAKTGKGTNYKNRSKNIAKITTHAESVVYKL